MKQFNLLSLFLILITFFGSANSTIVSHDERAITIDGQRRILLSGSIHYPRSTSDVFTYTSTSFVNLFRLLQVIFIFFIVLLQMWPDLISKAKDGGLDTIETYVFWNAHEPSRRQYDFSGNLDLVRFIKTIQSAGLYSVLRIGPYVCAEWNYGGFPVWLHNMPNMKFRTINPGFMVKPIFFSFTNLAIFIFCICYIVFFNLFIQNEMQNFTTKIVNMMKEESLFASQGGPIILAQVHYYKCYGNKFLWFFSGQPLIIYVCYISSKTFIYS